ncbi:MAG: radical SAM protein [Planctomycetes bacterium]|nr:radical SAM protein [Planctomycetota bacterium]
MTSLLADSEHAVLLEKLRAYLRQYYDLDERVRAWEERRFYSLEVELTNRCNRECFYCYNSSGRSCGIPDLPLDFVQRLIAESRAAGIRQIAWLGGEPTLYRELPAVFETAAQNGIENVLFTNGSLLTPSLWAHIAPLTGRIMFHLDTIAPDVFVALNNVTQLQGRRMLAQTLDNLDHILASGFSPDRIYFYVVLTRLAAERLHETLEFALIHKRLGTTALYPMVRTGRACSTSSTWALNRHELRELYGLRANLEHRPELMLLGPSEYCKHYQLTMAYVDVHRHLMPYAGLANPEFEIGQRSLSTLLSNHYGALSFSTLGRPDPSFGLTGVCHRCRHSTFCFGTRTTAFNVIGTATQSDPFCWET